MKRVLRLLILLAPVIVLLLGVPAGVALARRSSPSAPVSVITGPRIPTGANGTAQPRTSGNGPFIGPSRLFGPPLPISRARTGVNGTITRMTANRIVVYTKSKRVALIAIDPTTTIRLQGKNIKAAQLMRGDNVTILGRRDSAGAFHAELIRVTRPQPPDPPPGGAR